MKTDPCEREWACYNVRAVQSKSVAFGSQTLAKSGVGGNGRDTQRGLVKTNQAVSPEAGSSDASGFLSSLEEARHLNN